MAEPLDAADDSTRSETQAGATSVPTQADDSGTAWTMDNRPIGSPALPDGDYEKSSTRTEAIGETMGGIPTEAGFRSAAAGDRFETIDSRPPDSNRPISSGTPGMWGTIEASGNLVPGQVVFGKFLVLKKLGQGGMGSVWLVRNAVLGSDRALKLIVAGIAMDPQARGRFTREAKVMAQIDHPNAVVVHDAKLTESDVAYIEMQFVEGESLDKFCKKGTPMPLGWTARVLVQLCDVLQYAHDRKIIHRDLKPSNLMLVAGREEGKELLKVLDFGIAKVLGAAEGEDEAHTVTGAFMGTPPYTSPEQSEGIADARSDIYSTGVILYEFLTGRRPFTGPPARQIIDTQMTPPPPFATINPEANVPPEVERVVMRCLAKKPEDRPQSARELADEFLAALPESERAGAVVLTSPTSFRWTVKSIAAAVLALSSVACLAVVARDWIGPPVTTIGGGGGQDKPTPPLPPGGKYEYVDPTDLVAGWPKKMKRIADGTIFVRIVGKRDFSMGGIGGRAGTQEAPPAHTEAIGDFYIQEHEVTNKEVDAYCKGERKTPPEKFQSAFNNLMKGEFKTPASDAELHPAVGIPHQFAATYADWVGGRLPTAAEWEYVARSQGQMDRPYVWKGMDNPPKADDRRANIDSATTPGEPTDKVTTRGEDRTDQGVYDLTGNVREWTSTSAGSTTTGTLQFKVQGGSWSGMSFTFSTTTASEPIAEDEALDDLGFRVVIDWPKAKK